MRVRVEEKKRRQEEREEKKKEVGSSECWCGLLVEEREAECERVGLRLCRMRRGGGWVRVGGMVLRTGVASWVQEGSVRAS